MSIGNIYTITIRRANSFGPAELVNIAITKFSHGDDFVNATRSVVKKDATDGGNNLNDDLFVVTFTQPAGNEEFIEVTGHTLTDCTFHSGTSVYELLGELEFYAP